MTPRNGPFSPLTSQMTQPLWSDLLATMESLTEASDFDEPILSLNFGHSDTLLPFLTSLGLYRDEKDLKASDWPRKDHKWKTSKIGTFATNVGVMVFRCDEGITFGQSKQTVSERQVKDISPEGKLPTEKSPKKKKSEEKTSEEKTSEEKTSKEKSSEEESSEENSSEEESSEEDSSEENLSEDRSSEKNSSKEASSNENVSTKPVPSSLAAGWRVMVLHQERVVPLPACSGEATCSLEAFVTAFRGLAGEDFDSVCSV